MLRHWTAAAAGLLVLAACSTAGNKPMETVREVDLERFMGDWYVIANIPTFPEKGAHNAVESYRLEKDGTIDITFTYRKDGFDGAAKRLRSRGFVQSGDNAVWGVQFVWPIRADYRVAYLSPDYGQTVIGREKRDYVWMMARTPVISDADYQRMLKVVADLGYDAAKVEKVPQKWN